MQPEFGGGGGDIDGGDSAQAVASAQATAVARASAVAAANAIAASQAQNSANARASAVAQALAIAQTHVNEINAAKALAISQSGGRKLLQNVATPGYGESSRLHMFKVHLHLKFQSSIMCK